MSRVCAEYTILPCMGMKICIVAILSKIDVFNSQTQYLKKIYIAGDNFIDVLDYLDFERLSIVITKFPELVHNMLN